MERRKRWIGWALLAGCVGLLIGLSVVLATSSVGAYRTEIEGEYRVQAEQMAATYARAVGRWWLRGDAEMMAEAARLMVVGSARFARVVAGGEVLVELRDDDLAAEPALGIESNSTETPLTTRRTIGGVPTLDVLVPILVTGLDSPIGEVRIGFDLTSVTERVRARGWGVAGIAAACDAAAIGVVLGLVAVFRTRGRRTDRVAGPDAERVLVRGGLRIDPLSKIVTVRGALADLTPKQFDLLLLLAEVPDRVLSDDDILAAVWPESPYADSRDVKQCIYTLRQRLGRVLETPSDVVVNVTGYGYKLVPPGNGCGLGRA